MCVGFVGCSRYTSTAGRQGIATSFGLSSNERERTVTVMSATATSAAEGRGTESLRAHSSATRLRVRCVFGARAGRIESTLRSSVAGTSGAGTAASLVRSSRTLRRNPLHSRHVLRCANISSCLSPGSALSTYVLIADCISSHFIGLPFLRSTLPRAPRQAPCVP